MRFESLESELQALDERATLAALEGAQRIARESSNPTQRQAADSQISKLDQRVARIQELKALLHV